MRKTKLIGIMAEKGFSQRSIAKELGVSVNTINAKLNGRTAFDALEIIKLCEILGITNSDEKIEIFLQ
ncbi:MAG: helix-turn-helix transcriptional regulator [Clostridia bacterium]|nr:helix-turn-helix transcriptional regulator [Clostridia bacterium]